MVAIKINTFVRTLAVEMRKVHSIMRMPDLIERIFNLNLRMF